LAAGSYVRSAAFLDAYEHISWPKIEKMLEYKPQLIGAYVDITLGVVMMDRGYILHPWDQMTPLEGGTYHIADAPLVHGNKSYYFVALTQDDGKVIVEDEDLSVRWCSPDDSVVGHISWYKALSALALSMPT